MANTLTPYVVTSRNAAVSGVVSINGIQGEVTGDEAGLAASGVNSDITGLTALSGPLTLGADGTTDPQAVTVRQLNAAIANIPSGGGDGATVTVGASGFVGAVQWYNGSSATLPSGFVTASGQLLNRTDYPELWTAISNGNFHSTDDASWLASASVRGEYSTGDGSTTFRMPDLNGAITSTNTTGAVSSLGHIFLGGLDSDGVVGGVGVGGVVGSAVPNITGTFMSRPIMQGGSQDDSKAYSLHVGHSGAILNTWTSDAGLGNIEGPTLNTAVNTLNADGWEIDASKCDPVYGKGFTDEAFPNNALGIYIVQTTMDLGSAALTVSGLITGESGIDATRTTSPTPATGVSVTGGTFGSYASVDAGSAAHFSMNVTKTIGTNGANVALYVKDDIDGGANTWTFPYKGKNITAMAQGDFGFGSINPELVLTTDLATYCATEDPINWPTMMIASEEVQDAYFTGGVTGSYVHMVFARGGRPVLMTHDYESKSTWIGYYSATAGALPFLLYKLTTAADTVALENQITNIKTDLAVEKAARLALEEEILVMKTDLLKLVEMHKDIVAGEHQ